MSDPIDLYCPVCHAQPGQRCRTLTTGRSTDTHTRRPNALGFTGRDEKGRQQCMTCWGWKFPAIHSCPGVPQPGRVPPDPDPGQVHGAYSILEVTGEKRRREEGGQPDHAYDPDFNGHTDDPKTCPHPNCQVRRAVKS